MESNHPQKHPRVTIVGLQLTPSFGGPANTTADFARALNANAISFTTPEPELQEPFTIPDTTPVYHLPGKLGRFHAWAPRKNRKAAENLLSTTDVISCHICLRYHAYWVLQQSKKLNIPYVLVPHGSLDPYVFESKKLIKSLYMRHVGRALISRASRIIFATQREMEKARPYCSNARSVVINWPVDIPTGNRDAARISVRQEHKIPLNDQILLYLGRLHSIKQPIETIKAFIASNPTNSHLVMLGPDGDVTAQECIDAAIPMQHRIHILGPRFGSAKARYLQASDGFISLSLKENFGRTIAEAAAAGLPIIAAPNIDLLDELSPTGSVTILPNYQLCHAVAAISQFDSQGPTELSELGQRNVLFVKQHLTETAFQSKLRRLYADVSEEHKNGQQPTIHSCSRTH